MQVEFDLKFPGGHVVDFAEFTKGRRRSKERIVVFIMVASSTGYG